ncbi:MAG: Csu type fimbrial protein [Gammaproteobacteria bacterium]
MKIRGMRNVALIAASLVALPFAANADDTGTLAVSANVPKVCIVDSVGTMSFGDVNVAADTDTTADILWRCSKLSSTDIQLDDGNANNGVGARAMSLGLEDLGYELFRDSSRTLNWGETNGVDTQPVTGQGMGIPNQQTTTIYGRVTAAQAQAAAEGNNYTDSVTVTIVF